MTPRSGQSKTAAFTLLELLVVIAIIAILAVMLLPTLNHPDRFPGAGCMSKQKQIALGLLLFADDHQNRFPSMVSVTNGGAQELTTSGEAVPCFVSITDYGLNPSSLVCPTDRKRIAIQSGQTLTRTNLSYFVSLNASLTNPPSYSILTGDRHLESDGKPVAPGLFTLSPNQRLAWTAELHAPSKKPTGGTFGFADGHVEWASQKSLAAVVERQNMATNRLAVP